MTEAYFAGGDTWRNLTWFSRGCQSFIPRESHILFFIDLQLKALLLPTAIVIEVYESDGTHFPIGSPLSSTEVLLDYGTPFMEPYRFRTRMPAVALTKNQRYCIVAYVPLRFIFGGVAWFYDNVGAQYLRGIRSFSDDGGIVWTIAYGSDYYFAEFGTPPAPDIAPDPPINNWFPAQISIGDLSHGACITLITNVPCHLWMFITSVPPRKHPIPRIIRGVAVPWYTRFCFVSWYAMEQLEPGDTLYHTFQDCDWWPAQKKWFTFRGQVDYIDVPSVGPIFDYKLIPDPSLKNLSFEDWPDPDGNPYFWDRGTFGSGWSGWKRESNVVKDGNYSARLEAGGYARGTYFRQRQSAVPYRGQSLTFRAWGRGKDYPNNDFTVGVDGTGGWLQHDTLTVFNTWEHKRISGFIPWDAEWITLTVRCYSPGYGPVFGWWDKLTLEC